MKTILYQSARGALIRNILRTDVLKFLLEWIEKYLKDPATHQDGRQKILEKFCYKKDGKSAERIA